MELKNINIATARIRGLNAKPYYFRHKDFYAWDIMFEDTPTTCTCFESLPLIKVGNTKEEGEDFCNKLKKNFKDALIFDGTKVTILFEDNGRIIAIGNTIEDAWIDPTDKFSKKTFLELNIIITSLRVF